MLLKLSMLFLKLSTGVLEEGSMGVGGGGGISSYKQAVDFPQVLATLL